MKNNYCLNLMKMITKQVYTKMVIVLMQVNYIKNNHNILKKILKIILQNQQSLNKWIKKVIKKINKVYIK